jgi:hypothetical protein
MPASAPPTARELRERAEALLEHVRDTTPPWLLELEQLADDLERRYPPDGERPRLTLIEGGRADAS